MEQIKQRVEAVKNDREHGSRWLVREAIMILRDMAQGEMASPQQQMRLLYSTARELARARPAMAALSSAVSRVMRVEGGPPAIVQEAERLLREYDTATGRIAGHARPYLSGQLMTLSISGTVLEVLVACKEHIDSIIVLEGRPRYEGRETARLLQQQGIAVTLITDAQAGIFLPQCRAVVVGADSILANGDVLNKAGTALLAWAAQGHTIPFNVVCETLKITPRHWSGDPARLVENQSLLEEKEAQEVLEQPIPGVTVRNFYFDRTPYKLVSRWITERGALDRAQIKEIALQVEENERHLFEQNE